MERITKILIPTRPQPDTIVAIFLLKEFGKDRFSGISDACVEILAQLPNEETFDTLMEKGILALDLGGGSFDHHGKDVGASMLVARYLGIEKNSELRNLLTYAERDDKEGKGIVSKDPIDRAFGLSGLIGSLNKTYTNNPHKIIEIVLPLLQAHYHASKEHYVELPKDIERKKKEGHYSEHMLRSGGKTIKVASVVSSKPSMPAYVRSYAGPRADVALQKLEESNHYAILTRQERNIDLSMVAALIRMREAQLRGITLKDDIEYLKGDGRIDEIPMWYVDPATKSVLNGGPHNRTVEESKIPWEEFKKIVPAGLEMVQTPRDSAKGHNPAYYLAINVPKEVSSSILSKLSVSKGVKKHGDDNLHVTLEYFGKKNTQEVSNLVQSLNRANLGSSFEIRLRSGQLKGGSPEGYSNSRAWYLAIGEADNVSDVRRVRLAACSALGLENREKEIHITLASQRQKDVQSSDGEALFSEPFDVQVPISELVLMESFEGARNRIYRPYRVFTLQ